MMRRERREGRDYYVGQLACLSGSLFASRRGGRAMRDFVLLLLLSRTAIPDAGPRDEASAVYKSREKFFQLDARLECKTHCSNFAQIYSLQSPRRDKEE